MCFVNHFNYLWIWHSIAMMALMSNLKLVCPRFVFFSIRPASASASVDLVDFSPNCEKWREKLSHDMQIHRDFVSADEENNLLEEVELKFKRSKYQFDHWDDVSLSHNNYHFNISSYV